MKSIPYHTVLAICIFALIFSCKTKEKQLVKEVKKQPNVLFIAVDDLRPELNCFGANHISSPNIDKLAISGVSFLNHYVNAPSCGPSRYTLLTGLYGFASNNALFQRADKIKKGKEKIHLSMPEWFRANGYTTVSVGKISHHPGGRGGDNWDDDEILEMPGAWDKHISPIGNWEHPRGIMHGLANGEIRLKPSDMDVFQAKEGADNIYPDGITADEALKQLRLLSTDTEKPFFLAIGIIKPHLPFGAPKSYLDRYKDVVFPSIAHPDKPKGKTTWHSSGEFNKYNTWGKNPNTDSVFADEIRKHYAACVSYADAQVGKIMTELKPTGADKNTVVILWGDHGWHLGEHAIWGKHSLFDESLKSPLIIHYPEMNNQNFKTKAIVETLDIFPTLCDLAGLEIPEFVQGKSLRPILENQDSIGHDAFAYYKNARTIRTKTHRLTLHDDDYVELYDLTSEEKETKNISSKHPDLVDELKKRIKDKKLKWY